MAERASMPSIELYVFENREQLLGVRMSTGDKKPQRLILTQREASQLMVWLGRVTQRVISDEQACEASFDVDLLRDQL